MSRINASGIHVLFFLGVALGVLGLGLLLSPLNETRPTGENMDTNGCGLTTQVLVGLTFNPGTESQISAEHVAECQLNARSRGLIALSSLLVGGGAIAGATVWARRIYREDYRRPGVTSNGASTS